MIPDDMVMWKAVQKNVACGDDLTGVESGLNLRGEGLHGTHLGHWEPGWFPLQSGLLQMCLN